MIGSSPSEAAVSRGANFATEACDALPKMRVSQSAGSTAQILKESARESLRERLN